VTPASLYDGLALWTALRDVLPPPPAPPVYEVRFTGRKRNPLTGHRYQWRHGSWDTREGAADDARRCLPLYPRGTKAEVIVARKGAGW
jgi:hypothetical protein